MKLTGKEHFDERKFLKAHNYHEEMTMCPVVEKDMHRNCEEEIHTQEPTVTPEYFNTKTSVTQYSRENVSNLTTKQHNNEESINSSPRDIPSSFVCHTVKTVFISLYITIYFPQEQPRGSI